MQWNELISEEQIVNLKLKSFEKPQVIFKHSTSCNISAMVLNRLERERSHPEADFYILDLLQFRNLSNFIADSFQVPHESPQVILIKDGLSIYSESHYGINLQDISEIIAKIQ